MSEELMPLLGGSDQDVLNKDLDGKTAFEKEIEFFGSLLQKYPPRQVIYKAKPLMPHSRSLYRDS